MAIATTTRTDAEIQADVIAELKWEPRVQAPEIGVAVKDGVVTLTGWVDSYTKRWAAEEAAHRVRGVKAVANDIEVRLGIGGERTDARDRRGRRARARVGRPAGAGEDRRDRLQGLGDAEGNGGLGIQEARGRARRAQPAPASRASAT